MDIFISWSGRRSQAVANALRNWLPKIINAFKPWLSAADIDKGTRWSTDVAVRLEAAKAGIICLTPSNVHSDWILFEAGALSKTLENTFVCPLLIGLEPSDIKGPLAQFQATRVTREDILMLLKTLNTGLAETALADSHIEEAFEVWWPKLEGELKKLPKDEDISRPQRTEKDLLEEILSLVRNQNRATPQAVSEKLTEAAISHKFGIIARRLDRKLTQWTVSGKLNGYEIEARSSSGNKYKIVVPLQVSDAEFEARVLSGLTESGETSSETLA